MVQTVFMVLVILFLPWLVMRLTEKIPFLKKLGNVFWCYLLGLGLSFVFKALNTDLVLASDLASVLVCIAMPLILFSADLPGLKKLARPMLSSFGLNVLSVTLVAFGAYFLFRRIVPDAADISGMLIGITGYDGLIVTLVASGVLFLLIQCLCKNEKTLLDSEQEEEMDEATESAR